MSGLIETIPGVLTDVAFLFRLPMLASFGMSRLIISFLRAFEMIGSTSLPVNLSWISILLSLILYLNSRFCCSIISNTHESDPAMALTDVVVLLVLTARRKSIIKTKVLLDLFIVAGHLIKHRLDVLFAFPLLTV